MRIQSVGNYDCQRKNDVNFEAILMKRNAFCFLNKLFKGKQVLRSVRDEAFHFSSPGARDGCRNLYLTQQEFEVAKGLDDEKDFFPLFNYLFKLREAARDVGPKETNGLYTVAHIKQAIQQKTFDENKLFSSFPKVENLQDRLKLSFRFAQAMPKMFFWRKKSAATLPESSI